jgi:hypothetical protein
VNTNSSTVSVLVVCHGEVVWVKITVAIPFGIQKLGCIHLFFSFIPRKYHFLNGFTQDFELERKSPTTLFFVDWPKKYFRIALLCATQQLIMPSCLTIQDGGEFQYFFLPLFLFHRIIDFLGKVHIRELM